MKAVPILGVLQGDRQCFMGCSKQHDQAINAELGVGRGGGRYREHVLGRGSRLWSQIHLYLL